MKQLLKEWAELAPGECNAKNAHVLITVGTWSVVDPAEEGADDFIQIKVQKAIEAHHWRWTIKAAPSSYEAIIAPAEFYDGVFQSESNVSPAHALLDAYLAALKAVKVEEVAG